MFVYFLFERILCLSKLHNHGIDEDEMFPLAHRSVFNGFIDSCAYKLIDLLPSNSCNSRFGRGESTVHVSELASLESRFLPRCCTMRRPPPGYLFLVISFHFPYYLFSFHLRNGWCARIQRTRRRSSGERRRQVRSVAEENSADRCAFCRKVWTSASFALHSWQRQCASGWFTTRQWHHRRSTTIKNRFKQTNKQTNRFWKQLPWKISDFMIKWRTINEK